MPVVMWAQVWRPAWIGCERADSFSCVWFSRTYTFKTKPLRASLTLITTGLFDIYVNGRNVSTSALMPCRQYPEDGALGVSYQIERFLRRGNNVISVFYSPSFPHLSKRQVAVNLAGCDALGRKFCYDSDASWLCRLADRRLLPNGGEATDGASLLSDWTLGSDNSLALWTNASETESCAEEAVCLMPEREDGWKVSRIISPKYFDTEHDSVWYEFGTGFRGWIRITLRDAKPGEVINIGGLEYVCSGQMDEQACLKFTLPVCRRVLVCGDESFRVSQVQKVEGLILEPPTDWPKTGSPW